MKNTITLFVLLWSQCAPAFALEYEEYVGQLKSEAGRVVARSFLEGLGKGIGMYEVLQRLDKRPGRFCIPNGVPLSAELLAGLISQHVQETPRHAQLDVEVIAFTALALQFPCR